MLLVTFFFVVIFFSVYSIIKNISNLSSNYNVSLMINLLFYTVILTAAIIFSTIYIFFSHFDRRINKIEKIAVQTPHKQTENQKKEDKGIVTKIKGFFDSEITAVSSVFFFPSEKEKNTLTPKKTIKKVQSISKKTKTSEFSENGSKTKKMKNEEVRKMEENNIK